MIIPRYKRLDVIRKVKVHPVHVDGSPAPFAQIRWIFKLTCAPKNPKHSDNEYRIYYYWNNVVHANWKSTLTPAEENQLKNWCWKKAEQRNLTK